ncbi:LysR family transcriptional regulator [Streptomyces lanatus]|uniref:LysR family transcriptional regulator n=1 Tax=Streptomyces lanatus TaxID=66900 RepID=A0ABV1Y629_9ACTN|nr:LysR family transcriptional regulator [Streptomyces lanatus]GHH30331.1 transcriptional regulator [Streptomyces lanatus]
MARTRNWDLNLLIPLEVLLTECSVTRAARRLFLTQPAMSNALSRLRQHFNDPLLVRDGRAMRRTARGEDLLLQVRQLLAQINQLAPGGFDPATAERRFSVMMSDFAAMVLMPAVLRAVAGYPGISLRVVPYQASYAAELEEGGIDLLLTIDEHLMSNHPTVPLLTADWVAITVVDNPLVGDELTLEDYTSLRHVVVRYDDGRITTMEESYVRRHAIDRPVAMYVPSFTHVPWVLPGTTCLGVVPGPVAEAVRSALKLRVLPVPIHIAPIRENMQWHSRTDDDAGAAWLRSVILEAAAEVMPLS